MTREEWLNAARDALRPHFVRLGHAIPERVRVTCGFPSKAALARKARRIGECWTDTASADATHEIFVSPVLDDALEVLGVLAHELAHAAVGVKHKHRGPFAKLVRALGMDGKPKSASSGEAFTRDIARPILDALPAYPHAKLTASAEEKKQGTRMIKCECGTCGYVARTTRKWITSSGAPICPLDNVQMVAEGADSDEGEGD